MILAELRTNCWAKLIEINLPWEIRKHLMEVGILPETKIKMICKNPLGNIFLIQVGGTHIALSEKLARAIKIEYS